MSVFRYLTVLIYEMAFFRYEFMTSVCTRKYSQKSCVSWKYAQVSDCFQYKVFILRSYSAMVIDRIIEKGKTTADK